MVAQDRLAAVTTRGRNRVHGALRVLAADIVGKGRQGQDRMGAAGDVDVRPLETTNQGRNGLASGLLAEERHHADGRLLYAGIGVVLDLLDPLVERLALNGVGRLV